MPINVLHRVQEAAAQRFLLMPLGAAKPCASPRPHTLPNPRAAPIPWAQLCSCSAATSLQNGWRRCKTPNYDGGWLLQGAWPSPANLCSERQLFGNYCLLIDSKRRRSMQTDRSWLGFWPLCIPDPHQQCSLPQADYF